MERMKADAFHGLRDWLVDQFHTDMSPRGIADSLSVRVAFLLSKGDPYVSELVDDILYTFFQENGGYAFPSDPSFDWKTTPFGAIKTLWFDLLKERKYRDAHTYYIDNIGLYDLMNGDSLMEMRDWLGIQILNNLTPLDVVDELREQLEYALTNDSTISTPRYIERIVEDFFDDDIYFSFHPYSITSPVSQTEFGRLRQDWFNFVSEYEN